MQYEPEAIRKALRAMGNEAERRIHDLNSGGCGVYAYNVARQMAKRSIPHAIRSYGDMDYPLDKHAEELRKERALTDRNAITRHGRNRQHLVVEWNGHLYDSEGEWSLGRRYGYERAGLIPGPLPRTALKAWNRVRGLWNDWYDRRQNDKVARIVAKHFRKLDRGDYNAETWPNPDEWLLSQSAGGAI